MRWILFAMMLAGCSPGPGPQAQAERTLFAGEGRDRLCSDGDRAGFIAYGAGDANCSVRGRIERSEGRVALLPWGDRDCRIEVQLSGDSVRLGSRSEACAYYCGPGVDFTGRRFGKMNGNARDAKDLAGDPLC